jgi:hypothetical protein
MPGICGNCHQIINPGSITTPIMGSDYHSDCLYCSNCSVYLWNKPFIKKKDGTLYCGDNDCSTTTTSLKLPPLVKNMAPNVGFEPRNSSRQNQFELNKYLRTNETNTHRKNSIDSTTNSTRSSQDSGMRPFEMKKTAKKVSQSERVRADEPFIYNSKNFDSNLFLPSINGTSVVPDAHNANNIEESEGHFNSNCDKCFELIAKEKHIFNDKAYHRHCYVCDRCKTELYRMKKVHTDLNNQGMYCEPCFADMFGPKCAKCSQPVTPYMLSAIFEGKIYHKECFVCPRCKRSFAKVCFL